MKLLGIIVAAIFLNQQGVAATLMNIPNASPSVAEQVNPTERQIESFWRKVNKDGPIPSDPTIGNCWMWTGSTRGKYGGFAVGRLGIDYRDIQAHRFSYFLHNGILPKNLMVCHSCDTTLCVRPSHLFVGTHQDNMRDRDAKKRQAKGESQGASVLSDEAVLDIQEKFHTGERAREGLAVEYGVSVSLIKMVLRGEMWKHLSSHPRWNPIKTSGSRGRGEANGCHILSQSQVDEIRDLYFNGPRTSQQKLAKRFGVAQTTISAILRKETWS